MTAPSRVEQQEQRARERGRRDFYRGIAKRDCPYRWPRLQSHWTWGWYESEMIYQSFPHHKEQRQP